MQSDYKPDSATTETGSAQSNQVSTIDLSEYTSFGSYTPLYIDKMDALFNDFNAPYARYLLSTVYACAAFASEIGTYFAGPEAIMDRVHIGYGTARSVLKTLSELDIIRVHKQWVTSRRRYEVTYQLSPHNVLHIRPTMIREAIDLWNLGAPLDCNEMFNGQPESEPESETSTQNQRKFNQTQNQRKKPAAETRRSRQQVDQRPPTRYPGEVEIEKCRAPLQNAADEMAADRISKLYRSRIQQTRQWILSYGTSAVWRAANQIEQRVVSGEAISNPGGAMLAALRKDAQERAAPNSPPAAQATVTGQYSEFFDR